MHNRRKDRVIRKCAAMRAAKERKRLERAESMTECGRILTTGCLGEHDIRLLAYPDDGLLVAVVVDGVHKRPRSVRGVWRCVAKMIGGNHAE